MKTAYGVRVEDDPSLPRGETDRPRSGLDARIDFRMTVRGFHITFGTYGTRLHGDLRGTVDRDHNQFGTPVLGFDQHLWEREKSNLKFDAVIFTREQMIFIEQTIPAICTRGGWAFITSAAGPKTL